MIEIDELILLRDRVKRQYLEKYSDFKSTPEKYEHMRGFVQGVDIVMEEIAAKLK